MAQTIESGTSKRTWQVALALVLLFAAALFLRTYWNADAAVQNGHFVLSSGSDPYYEKRAIDAILASHFHTLIQDPLLNYPFGSVNPNPPLYQWSVAVAGKLLEPMFSPIDLPYTDASGAAAVNHLSALDHATWWATEWAPAIYGSLTIIPIYFMGVALFGRREGILAAVFWTVSTEAVDVTGLGDSRHYAAAMFFTSLAFLFYIKTIQQFRGDGNWVTKWSDGSTVGRGLGDMLRGRRVGFAYALLTGVSIAAVALMWKGFPYIIGTMFLYAAIQMVIDHWRNKDSTGLFLATAIAVLVGTLVAYPYYAKAGITNFLTPVWFMIVAFIVGGLVLVPTRDLPSILVMPTAIVVAILGALVAFFALPAVAQGLLYSTVYFKQTALYETIAEAHPADFSNLVFGVGPVPFFLGVAAWVGFLFTLRRHPQRPILFAIVWAAVAVYMAHSAIRFLFNAIPVFALFGAAGMVWLWDWLDFAAYRKSFAANRGQAWTGFRKGFRVRHAVIGTLLVLLLVLPNAVLAFDAAIPPQKEQQYASNTNSQFLKDFYAKRFGAYGQGFLPQYWLDGLTWLDQYDANTTDLEKRPAFLSWWDYGHWAIAIGHHPTVADNFQNGYKNAAYFILAQNETQATQLMAARIGTMLDDAKLQSVLTAAGSTDAAGDATKVRVMGCETQDNSCHTDFLADLDLAKSADLLSRVEKETGKRIRYFTTDIRMLPYDDPATTNQIEQSSIYYAPVKLAGQDPDDYVTLKVQVASGGSTGFITQKQFEILAKNPVTRPTTSGERLDYQKKFFESMYWRGYAGTPTCDEVNGRPTLTCIQPDTTQPSGFPVQGDKLRSALNAPQPAWGMEHFRLVYASDALKIVSYYPGAVVKGKITQDGAPLAGVSLTAYDDAGTLLLPRIPETFRAQVKAEDLNVPHQTVTSGPDGSYSVLAPFAMPGGNVTIVATKDGVEIARTYVPVTREDAESSKEIAGTDLVVKLGTVVGTVFEDANGDGTFNATNEHVLAGETITVANRSVTTDANGTFTLDKVAPGRADVASTSPKYDVHASSKQLTVRPGEETRANISLVLKPGTLKGVAYADINGDGVNNGAGEVVQFASLTFTADTNVTGNTAQDANALTDANGNYTAQLHAGTYLVTASYTATDGAKYALNETVTIASGQTIERELKFTKTA